VKNKNVKIKNTELNYKNWPNVIIVLLKRLKSA
jgi:hypothetical protein